MNLAIFCLILSASAAYAAKVKVYHSIVGGPNVDVCVGASPLVKNLAYRAQSYYFTVAAGTYNIDVRVANADPCEGALVFANPGVVIGSDPYYSVAAHGLGDDAAPYGLLALVDNNVVAADESAVRFVHSCAGAPNVDVSVDGTVAFTNVSYGEAAAAQDLAAGTYDIEVFVTGTSTSVFGPATLTFSDRSAYTIFASGDVGDLPLEPFVSIDSTDKTAMVKVIHAVAELDAPTVDVYVNGEVAIPDFKYGAVVGYVSLPALQITIDVKLAGQQTEVLVPVTTTLDADAFYSVVAHGDSLPISLLLLADDNTAPAAGNVNVRFIHASAGSPAVDVIVDGDVAFANVEYGDETDYVTIPTSTYEISVNLAGTETVVVNAKDLTFKTTEVASVYAIGIAGNTDATMLKALPLEDAPDSRVLSFNSAAGALPSLALLLASLALALAF